jgi:glycosyltransferase involved in cell wall biosynthesis
VTSPDLVSVIVTTRNVGRTIEACLRSIRAQDYAPIEVLVVDNHSDDQTQSVAARHADRLLVEGPERSSQRNRGVAEARGTWVLWIDADMVLAPNVVSSAMSVARREDVTAVSIPETTTGPGFWTACRALERTCYLDDPGLFNPRLLHRDLLLGLGGFSECMAGPEDADLRLRLASRGVRVGHAPAFIEHDEGRLALRDVIRKRIYYGRSLPAFAERNPRAVRHQAVATLRAFGRHRARLLRQPGHAAGMLFLRGVEAVAYAYGARRGSVAAGR